MISEEAPVLRASKSRKEDVTKQELKEKVFLNRVGISGVASAG